MKRITAWIALGVLSVANLTAHAQGSYNGRAMALSDAGVANGHYSYAVAVNPANALHYHESDDFNLNINAGALFSDEDELIDNGEDLADLLDALDQLDTLTPVADLQNILDTLELLDLATARLSLGANLTLAIPNKALAAVLYANVSGGVAVRTDVSDADIANIQLIIDDINNGTTNSTNIDVDTLGSSVTATGIKLTEVGLALARQVSLAGHEIALGLTPKYQNVETIVYSVGVASFDSEDFDADNYIEEDSNINLDMGVSVKRGNWYAGASLINALSQDYDTVDPAVSFSIKPRLSLGAAYDNGWAMLALDVDANASQDLATGEDVQEVRLGAELDAWNTVQLRLGVRHDLEGNIEDTVSAGLGFSPFGVLNIDVSAVVGDKDTVGGAIQLGLSF